jgi:hypothetical protein
MLHSLVYNGAYTEDLKIAVFNRDLPFFITEIKTLSAQIAARADEDFKDSNNDAVNTKYDSLLSRLLLTIALYDSIAHDGKTIQLICDMVNF